MRVQAKVTLVWLGIVCAVWSAIALLPASEIDAVPLLNTGPQVLLAVVCWWIAISMTGSRRFEIFERNNAGLHAYIERVLRDEIGNLVRRICLTAGRSSKDIDRALKLNPLEVEKG